MDGWDRTKSFFGALFLACAAWFVLALSFLLLEVWLRELGLEKLSFFPHAHEIKALSKGAIYFASLLALALIPLAHLGRMRSASIEQGLPVTLCAFLISVFVLYVQLIPLSVGDSSLPHELQSIVLIIALSVGVLSLAVTLHASPMSAYLPGLCMFVMAGLLFFGLKALVGPMDGCLGQDSQCLARRAAQKIHPAYCEMAERPHECLSLYAKLRGDRRLCNQLPDVTSSMECLLLFASDRSDQSICRDLNNPELEQRCLLGVVERMTMPDDCLQLAPGEVRDGCVMRTLFKDPRSHYCMSVSKEKEDECRLAVALSKNNVSVCQSIRDDSARDSCLLMLAKKSKSKEPCAFTSPAFVQGCEQAVRLETGQ